MERLTPSSLGFAQPVSRAGLVKANLTLLDLILKSFLGGKNIFTSYINLSAYYC